MLDNLGSARDEADRRLRTAKFRRVSRVCCWSGWRLVMQNGLSIVSARRPGADIPRVMPALWTKPLGALFKAALLSTLLGVGSELAAGSDTGNNGDIIQALRRGSSESLNQTGQEVVQRNLNIQPTLTVGPGFPVRAIVNHDLDLEPCSV